MHLFLRCAFLALIGAAFTAQAQVEHRLEVELSPTQHTLRVTDHLDLSVLDAERITFALHAGLALRAETADSELRRLTATEIRRQLGAGAEQGAGGVPLAWYEVRNTGQLTLRYEGSIYHPIENLSEEYARAFSVSPGLISESGVFLAGASYWYPVMPEQRVGFTLSVNLPPDWRAVSQGARVVETNDGARREIWSETQPQEEIYLMAGAFHEYHDTSARAEAMVFLRTPDPALAQRYLGATVQYRQMYEKLLGPYPYAKFAMVENFWETGYGMPSFTLLGPKVIRFPFILHSSYPHEILHNWWGNGVYIDYEQGNWAEGLTSYLADHLIKEQRGQGAEYRRNALQKYTDYVRDSEDFPLTAFRARHSAVTEAVGYGKTLMLFHMLRQELGDARFIEGLRHLYKTQRFRVASFADVEASFSAVAERQLDEFFAQWVERTGAPKLRVTDARTEKVGNEFVLSATLEQLQPGAAYSLSVPIAVHTSDASRAWQGRVQMNARRMQVELRLPQRPLMLDVDPEFDLFRRLDRNEVPPAVSAMFGAKDILVILPARAPAALRGAYRELAEGWQQSRSRTVKVVQDIDIERLPEDKTVWVLGWSNRWRDAIHNALSEYPFAVSNDQMTLGETTLPLADHSVVGVARHPGNPELSIALLASDNPAAMRGLARKLPHYGKYSYLAFSGDEPTNVAKGQWPLVGSPLSVSVAQADGYEATATRAKLAPRAPLAQLPPLFSAERMLDDVRWLSDPARAGRSPGEAQHDEVAGFIAERFAALGLTPGGETPDSYYQRWQAGLDPPLGKTTLTNVVGVIAGTDPQRRGESVVVGAHYDHLGRGWPDAHEEYRGEIHPGADDNASGVAVLLELARVLSTDLKPARSVVFVAFDAEEAGRLGSQYYVTSADAHPAAKAIGMINFDTVGRLGQQPLQLLGVSTAREWPHIFRGAGFVTGVAVKPISDDLGGSDHTSFIEAGIPAVQFFSGAHEDYHRPGDTADKIDAAGLTKIAAVAKEAIEYLASRPEPMTASTDASRAAPVPATGGRRVSFGTVPDFAYAGPGVRLSGVTTGSPAAEVGLREGDIITAVNDKPVADLRSYAAILRALTPGDTIVVDYRRGAEQRRVSAQVETR